MSDSDYYDDWVADGKPWRNAQPVAEIIAKLKDARPAAANAGCFGSIGNLEHLLADPPQDHTPYSQTGWPLHSPYPVVCASDIMHRPDLGVDCNAIHAHLLADAKAGKLPWLKYWIWQGKRYDVRNNWVPVAASGHFDHIHISIRTDHVNTSIGSWHPLPGMDDDMADYGDLKAPTNLAPYNYNFPDTMLADIFAALVIGDTGWGTANGHGADSWALYKRLAAIEAKVANPEIDYDLLASKLAEHMPKPPVPPTAAEIAKAVLDAESARLAQ